MDLVDLLILLLRIAVVALLYLFLLLVLRMASRGLSVSATAMSRNRSDRLRLIVLEPGASNFEPGQVIEIDGGSTVGRAQRSDVVLADATVSAEHARVERVGRAWVVTDLGSTNGTSLNQQPVRGNAPLTDGDVLGLGTVRLQVVLH